MTTDPAVSTPAAHDPSRDSVSGVTNSIQPRFGLSARSKRIFAFEGLVLVAAVFAYAFGIRPQMANVSYKLAVDVLFVCALSTIVVIFLLLGVLLSRKEHAD